MKTFVTTFLKFVMIIWCVIGVGININLLITLDIPLGEIFYRKLLNIGIFIILLLVILKLFKKKSIENQ